MQSKSKKKRLGTLRKCDRKEQFFERRKFDLMHKRKKNIDRKIRLLPHQVALKEFPNKIESCCQNRSLPQDMSGILYSFNFISVNIKTCCIWTKQNYWVEL